MPGSGQIESDAVQTSPDGLVARAEILSVPAALPRRRSTLNEPLGAFVRALVFTATLPLRLIVTCQRTPVRFWSTSNSVSSRPLSGLTLSLEEEDFVQEPLTVLAFEPPCFAAAVAGATTRARTGRR